MSAVAGKRCVTNCPRVSAEGKRFAREAAMFSAAGAVIFRAISAVSGKRCVIICPRVSAEGMRFVRAVVISSNVGKRSNMARPMFWAEGILNRLRLATLLAISNAVGTSRCTSLVMASVISSTLGILKP